MVLWEFGESDVTGTTMDALPPTMSDWKKAMFPVPPKIPMMNAWKRPFLRLEPPARRGERYTNATKGSKPIENKTWFM